MNHYTFTVNNELRITSWNEGAEAITRKRSSEVLGLPYFKVLPRISCGRSDALSQVLKELTPKTLKGYRISCFCGSEEADINLQPINDLSGMPSGVAVTIDTRPVCVLSSRLDRSQQLIDIGKIASTLAHGVRNPLNAIKGAVVYLREKYAAEKTLVEFTEIMKEEISRLEKFVTEFLSTNINCVDVDNIDVNASLRKLEILTSLQAQVKNIFMEFKYGDIPRIQINYFQFEQAILNVLNNAIDAVNVQGRITVESRTAQMAGQEFVTVAISDNGPGMAVRRIGDFPRISEESTSNKGKGFGLFLTREIVTSHGGHMEVQSSIGAGTAILLYFPVSDV